MSRTAVIGAGISGLALAHALQRRGEEVRVIEASEEPGGVMRTAVRDGFLLEWGPNSFLDKEPALRALVDELGLGSSVVASRPEARERWVVRDGRLVPVPHAPPQLLSTPLLSAAAKLRLLAEPILARRATVEDESLESFGHRHLGREATARLLDAIQTGIYAGRIEELSAASTFPELVRMERESRSLFLGAIHMVRRRGGGTARLCTLERGMGQLARALAERLGASLQLGTRVDAVSRREGGWRIETRRGAVDAERIAIATRPTAAAALLREMDPDLSAALNRIESAPLIVVHLGVARERLAHSLEGFGFLAPAEEQREILGCVFSSALFAGRAPRGSALFTVLMGGRRRPDLLQLDDQALATKAQEDLGALLGLQGRAEMVNVVRHQQAIPQYTVGHAARVAAIEACAARHPGLAIIGSAYHGVAVADCVRGARALADQWSRA